MRIPLAVDITSRDGTLNKDSRIKNGIVEGSSAENSYVRNRFGNTTYATVASGEAQLMTEFNGDFVAIVGDVMQIGGSGSYASGASWTSNGNSTQLISLPPESFFHDVASGVVYAVAGTSYIRTCYATTDYKTWTTLGTIINDASLHGTGKIVKFGSNLYYLCPVLSAFGANPPSSNEIYSSSNNGVSWGLLTSNPGYSARTNVTVCVHNGYLYLAGGATSGSTYAYDVYRTSDGTNWTQKTDQFTATSAEYASSLVSDGTHLIIVDGLGNKHLSTDGISWSKTSLTGLSPVDTFDAFYYNSKVWLFQHTSSGGDLKYIDADDTAWNTATNTLPFETSYHKLVATSATLKAVPTYSSETAYSAVIDTTSGGASVNLSPLNGNLQFSAQSNGANAESILFIKNSTQAWTLNTSDVATAVSDVDYPGNYSVTLSSLTRSGTVATATLPYDTNFIVGGQVIIAGATPNDYNGTFTITGVTPYQDLSTEGASITISRNGSTATAVAASAHGLTTGDVVTIAGCVQSEWNGQKTVTVVDAIQFTFPVTVTPAYWTPVETATGTPVISSAYSVAYPINNFALSYLERESGTNNIIMQVDGYIDKTMFGMQNSGYMTFSGGVLDGVYFVRIAIEEVAYGTSSSPYNSIDRTGYVLISNSSGLSNPGSYASGNVSLAAPTISSIVRYSSTNAKLTLDPSTGSYTPADSILGSTSLLFPYLDVTGCDQSQLNVTYFGSYSRVGLSLSDNEFAANVNYTYTAESPSESAYGTPVWSFQNIIQPSFTYTVAGSPTTPATGTITATSGRLTVPGVAYLDGSFYVMDVYGVIYGSDTNEPNQWDALNFLTAQSETGAGKAIAKSMSYVVAFKEWSTEFFYNAANADGSPLSRVDSGFTNIGCANGWTVASIDGMLAWVSQVRQQGRGVSIMQGTEQQKVSTQAIDRILNEDAMSDVRAYGVKISGHALYVLTLIDSGITLVYDITSKVWYEWTTNTLNASTISVSSITQTGGVATVTTAAAHGLSDGDPCYISGAGQSAYNGVKQARVLTSTTFAFDVDSATVTPATGTITVQVYDETYFKLSHHTYAGGKNLALHKTSGVIYELSDTDTSDDGAPIDLDIRMSEIDDGSTTYKVMGKIEVIGNKVNSVALVRWTDDDYVSYSTFRPVDLDSPRSQIRRCGNYRRRAIEVRHIADASVQLNSLEI